MALPEKSKWRIFITAFYNSVMNIRFLLAENYRQGNRTQKRVAGAEEEFDGRMLAQVFQSRGLTTLALAYVLEEGLPQKFPMRQVLKKHPAAGYHDVRPLPAACAASEPRGGYPG